MATVRRSTVGEKAKTFLEAGLDGLIFNMPAGSSPDEVTLLGETLSSALGVG